jgi:hypothetical protein
MNVSSKVESSREEILLKSYKVCMGQVKPAVENYVYHAIRTEVDSPLTRFTLLMFLADRFHKETE